MKTIKTLKTVALAGLMGSALLLTGCGGGGASGFSSIPTSQAQFEQQWNSAGSEERAAILAAWEGLSTSSKKIAASNLGTTVANLENTAHSYANGLTRVQDTPNGSVLGNQGVNKKFSVDFSNVIPSQTLAGATISFEDVSVDGLASLYNELDQTGLGDQTYNFLGESEQVDIFSLAASEINKRLHHATPVSDDDVKKAIGAAIEVKAPNAWVSGWTGHGVTLSRYEATSDSAKALVTASAIAPGAQVISGVLAGDIEIYSDQVRFSDPSREGDHSIMNITSPIKVGKVAGIGALVMHKFPTATNLAVGNSVNQSNGNALSALSPQMP